MSSSFSSRVMALCSALLVFILGHAHGQAIVRIMPLGDSITYGMGAGPAMIPGGYRDPLARLYAANNANFLLVGSDGTNSTPYLVTTGQQFNEGHTGWRIDQIQGSINTWMDNATPNVVLLHIGTNDILQNFNLGTGVGYDTSSAIQRLTTLINSLYAKNPSLKLVLSTLIPIQDTRDNYVKNYNAALVSNVVPNFISQGKSIVLVDNYANFIDGTGNWKTALFADYAHPNADGYAAMAATYGAVPLPVVQGVTFDSKSAAGAGGEDSAVAVNLLRAGQSTLSSVSAPPVSAGSPFPAAGLNDGSAAANANYTYYPVTGTAGTSVMPATVTFELNTATNTGGYDISSVQAITGWGDHNLGAQRFQLLLSINHDDYQSYGVYSNGATVNGGNSSFLSTVSHSSGILATHVTGVRFVFLNPDTSNGTTAVGTSQAGGGSTGGTVIRELQAFGMPSTPLPTPPFSLTGGATTGANSQDGAIVNNLIRQGQPTLSSVTAASVSLPANFTTAGLNDGSAATNANLTYYSVTDSNSGATPMPDTVTFELNTATNPYGYEIEKLQVISGWGDHNLGQVRFQLLMSVNHGEYTDYGTYRNTVALGGGNGGYLSTLNPTDGTVTAHHITGIRFVFLNPDRSNGDYAVGASQVVSSGGSVIREVQAFGYPSTSDTLSYSDWATNTWHLTGNDALPTSDPNGNGLANLLEYALGGDPTSLTPGAFAPVLEVGGTQTNYHFNRYTDRPDANLTVQLSDDLVTWTDVARSTAGGIVSSISPDVTVNETDGPGTVKYVMVNGLSPGSTGAGRRFVRLQASN